VGSIEGELQMPATKLGILASIDFQYQGNPPTSALAEAVASGYGQSIPKTDVHYSIPKGHVKDNSNRGDLLNPNRSGGPCGIIATIGGLWMNSEVNSDNQNFKFLSLVASAPDTNPQGCYGGVSLDTWKSNSLRIGWLRKAPRTIPLDHIALYQDQYINNTRGPVQQLEYDNWNSINGHGPIYPSSGNFHNDFNTAGGKVHDDANIQAVIISASPYFELHKNDLVTETNAWINAGNNRYVVYPLQIYGEATTPTPQPPGSILYGPDLYSACRVLGGLARAVADAGADAVNLGFFTAPNITPP
jgi:hypothetical protein